MGEAVFRFK